jgi:hypothetical protein
MTTRALCVLLCLGLGLGLAACGHPDRRAVIATSAPADYPGALPAPDTLAPDFMVRQSLTIRTQKDGKPLVFELDAVLQKQGAELLIVGFGPMNARAFTLTQRADRIEFEQFMGPQLPFSPRNIVLDVHRVYFKRLPDTAPDGVSRGELDGERVEETWQDGELRTSVFTRPDSALTGAVRVERGPGCERSRCEPATATLHNEWFGYTLTIASEGYERL